MKDQDTLVLLSHYRVQKVKMDQEVGKENKEAKGKAEIQVSMEHLVSLVPQVFLVHPVAKEQLELVGKM